MIAFLACLLMGYAVYGLLYETIASYRRSPIRVNQTVRVRICSVYNGYAHYQVHTGFPYVPPCCLWFDSPDGELCSIPLPLQRAEEFKPGQWITLRYRVRHWCCCDWAHYDLL